MVKIHFLQEVSEKITLFFSIIGGGGGGPGSFMEFSIFFFLLFFLTLTLFALIGSKVLVC